MSRIILVSPETGNEYRITIPDDSTLTFGPFSPPTAASQKGGYGVSDRGNRGTLRVYSGNKAAANNVIGVFTGVESFRDLGAIDLAEKLVVEQGATVWNSDKNGYVREERVNTAQYFEGEEPPALAASVAEKVSGDDF